VFAHHHHPGQDMLALRLQPEEAATAFDKIAVRLGRKVRPRTGSMPAIPIVRNPTPPTEGPDESSPMHTGADPTGVFVPMRDSVATTMPVAVEPVAPPVPAALDWARRATELEVTEPQLRIDPPPAAAATSTSSGVKVRPSSVVALAAITAIIMVAALVGGALWIGQPSADVADLAPRESIVPEPEPALPETSARIPTVEPAADRDDAPHAKSRASRDSNRASKRAPSTRDRERTPLAELAPPPPVEPAPPTTTPVAEAEPLRPEPHAEATPPTPPAETATTATAEPAPKTPVEPPA
jgi:hypothetical protein